MVLNLNAVLRTVGAGPASWSESLTPALMERLVLLLNHVLSREPAAQERLKPHAGALLDARVEAASPIKGPLAFALPVLPPLVLRITPAGLFEWAGSLPESAPALRVRMDGQRPWEFAQALAGGQVPPLQVEGDARLAADIDWLAANLRWDLADELQSVFGPGIAQGFTLAGAALKAALESLRSVSGRAFSPGPAGSNRSGIDRP